MDRKTFLGCLTALLVCAGCSKHRLTVGSKNFTEQVILGEIIAQQIENRLHQPVERKLNLGGMLLAHSALLNKDIDLYPEYTGTAFANILKSGGVTDPQVVLDRVRNYYAANLHLDWLAPLGFNSSFALAVRGDDARARHLVTLSDAARDPAGFALGAGYEFLTHPDGFPALNTKYSIKWTAPTRTMDLGLLYRALTDKQVSMVAGNTTDGVLNKLDAKVLEDDQHAFPPYQASIVVREDTLAAYPELRQALSALSGKIPNEVMRNMNYAVDVEHRPVREVASEFLKNAGQ